MRVAQPTMLLWQMMWRPMPMLRPKRSMQTQRLRREVPKWHRAHRRWPRRLQPLVLRHPKGVIFFLNHGSPWHTSPCP